jgi:hypothetical protein
MLVQAMVPLHREMDLLHYKTPVLVVVEEEEKLVHLYKYVVVPVVPVSFSSLILHKYLKT